MTNSCKQQSLAWVKALYVCAFGREPEAVWHTKSLRSERPLSFFFRHAGGLCAGALGLSLPEEEERTAESLRVFMSLQHRFVALSDASALPPELAPRPLPLLRGLNGVAVARGQDGWLALANEDVPGVSAPWSTGQRLWLALRLSTPPRPGLVVVFPQRVPTSLEIQQGAPQVAAQNHVLEASLESSCGRRRLGLVDVEGGRLWFQPCPVGLSGGGAARAATNARVSVILQGCGWRASAGGPRRLALNLGATAGQEALSPQLRSAWQLVSQGGRHGLRFQAQRPLGLDETCDSTAYVSLFEALTAERAAR